MVQLCLCSEHIGTVLSCIRVRAVTERRYVVEQLTFRTETAVALSCQYPNVLTVIQVTSFPIEVRLEPPFPSIRTARAAMSWSSIIRRQAVLAKIIADFMAFPIRCWNDTLQVLCTCFSIHNSRSFCQKTQNNPYSRKTFVKQLNNQYYVFFETLLQTCSRSSSQG